MRWNIILFNHNSVRPCSLNCSKLSLSAMWFWDCRVTTDNSTDQQKGHRSFLDFVHFFPTPNIWFWQHQALIIMLVKCVQVSLHIKGKVPSFGLKLGYRTSIRNLSFNTLFGWKKDATRLDIVRTISQRRSFYKLSDMVKGTLWHSQKLPLEPPVLHNSNSGDEIHLLYLYRGVI